MIKAREDEQRLKNQAEAYSNGVIPEARGRAQRVLEEANAYREQVVAQAQGEADRFLKLLRSTAKPPTSHVSVFILMRCRKSCSVRPKSW